MLCNDILYVFESMVKCLLKRGVHPLQRCHLAMDQLYNNSLQKINLKMQHHAFPNGHFKQEIQHPNGSLKCVQFFNRHASQEKILIN